MTLLLTLFGAFFQVGLLAFGGGLAALPLIREQAVTVHGWITQAAFTDLITIAEMTPGPIALNAATFVGYRVSGVAGSVVATFGCIAPSVIIVLILARLYASWKNKPAFTGVLGGLRPGAVALIASAGLSILLLALFGDVIAINHVDWVALGCFALGLIALRVLKTNPMLVIFGAGVLGAAVKLALGLE